MLDIFLIEEIAVGLLLLATIVGILARRLHMPYTVGLVTVGILLAFLYQEFHFDVNPDLILGIFVPPLIFEAAFHLSFQDLRRNVVPILTLAVAGVLVTTFLVGGVVTLGTGLPFAYAILFGAMISATDPIAVISLFRTLGVPKRLQLLIEGESLFNDGTAIVLFGLAISMVDSGSFSIISGLANFLRIAGLGVIIGLLLGWLASLLISRIDDYLIETALTFVLAYGAYVVAESLHVSGVLAVVTAGLINGNIGPRGMSPTTRIVVFNFWEFISFLTNSFVFLLIGLVINVPLLVANWQAILWGILAALLARLLIVYGLFPRSNVIPLKWKHVLFWGGLRGAISLALALGLTSQLGSTYSPQLQAMVFGLVIFTLLFQGTTMSGLLRRLGISPFEQGREDYDLRRARTAATSSGYAHLKRIHSRGMISSHVWGIISDALNPYIKGLTDSVQSVLQMNPQVEAEELDSAWREFLRHQRNVVTELFSERSISEDVCADLTNRIDELLASHEIHWESVEDVNNALWKVELDKDASLTQPDWE
ncbi:MAG: Na+/H+ antiporter [Anaerolineales bacterium]|nr:Na+/H+ antiporter [Anaerolineales bacterium]